jgi:hypothetical protein
MFFLGIIVFFCLIIVFVRYEPKFDLVVSYNKKHLLLWYNKYDGKYVSRTYVKLFTL